MPYENVSITWEVYRRFLEESGIKQEVTKILHKIWEEPEKPPFLQHYIRKHFAGGRLNAPNIALIRKDLVWKKEVIKQLRKRNEKLKNILSFYETPIVEHLKEAESHTSSSDIAEELHYDPSEVGEELLEESAID